MERSCHDFRRNCSRLTRTIFRAPFTCKGRILWGNGPVPSILRKKPWLSIRRCPLHANPEELVLEVIAAFLATQGPCTGSTSFGQLSLRGLQLGNQICRSMMSIFHHKNYKNLVSFAGRVASSKQPSMAKQQRLVVSTIAVLDPFRSYHFRWWVEVSCGKHLIDLPCSLHTHADHTLRKNGFASSKAVIQHRNLAVGA